MSGECRRRKDRFAWLGVRRETVMMEKGMLGDQQAFNPFVCEHEGWPRSARAPHC
jgi:hypothetical protein